MKKTIALLTSICSLTLGLVGCANKNSSDNEITIRNLYFNDWSGGDTYTNEIEEKFDVHITPSSYSWADWDQQVYGPAQANNLTDVFHFDLDSYNFANSYEYWAKGHVIKALPDDMSKWQNLNKAISAVSNLGALKLNGKLYCLPIIKNTTRAAQVYSPFTYVYRRDWAKELNVYQENDIYTWDQFKALLDAFLKNKCQSGDITALADVEWGYPSVLNFYKNAPHCFDIDKTSGKVVSNFSTTDFLNGLETAKSWTSGTKKYYGYDQYAAKDGDVAKQYYAGRVGVFYENLSLANYTTLRKSVDSRTEINTKEKLDDATAIMKVQGPDGKYSLEGTENWFSATFFNYDISDAKMNKVLDILDYLLSDDGTKLALYGKEGYDYNMVDGQVQLSENGWEKDQNGNYIDKFNGAKYLRYMATLGYDTADDDPLTDKDSLKIINDWSAFMDEQNAKGNLRVLEEDGSVKWLSTPTKSTKAGGLLENANASVTQYCYNKITKDKYLTNLNTSDWQKVLSEINEKLGK